MTKTDFEAELLSALHMIVNAIETLADQLNVFDGDISGSVSVEIDSIRI